MHVDELSGSAGPVLHFVDRVDVPNLVAVLQPKGIHVAEVDFTAVESKHGFLERLGKALSFPSYSVSNWDAFEESIRDLSWIPAAGYVLVAHSAEEFMRRHPRLIGQLVESWSFCAEEWRRQAKPFHLVLRW